MTVKRRSAAPDERGVALVLALLVTLALSAITASMILASRTEAFSSMNYRMLAQTRYGAEAGLHQTVNYLRTTYTPPGSAADPLANYDMTTSPVKYNGAPVVLSSAPTMASNYPVAAVVNGFQAATPGTLANDAFSVAYSSYATLLSVRQQSPVYGSTTTATFVTWQITATGSIGARNAVQEVSAIFEQQLMRPFTYTVFSTGACDALTFSGGALVDSYDSSSFTLSGGNVVTQAFGASVGTNGSVGASPSTTIDGTLAKPRAGVSGCGGAQAMPFPTVTAGVVDLPQVIPFPLPALPDPMPPTGSVTLPGGCAGLAGCSLVTDGVKLAAGAYPDVTVGGGAVLHLSPGATYTINSLSLTGASQITVDAAAPQIVMILGGQGSTTPLDLTSGTLVNPWVDPSTLQIWYSGTGQLTLTGGNRAAAVIYAPKASVVLTGGSDWFGSIVAQTFDDRGGAAVHYDRHLSSSPSFIPGNWTLNSFTWKTF